MELSCHNHGDEQAQSSHQGEPQLSSLPQGRHKSQDPGCRGYFYIDDLTPGDQWRAFVKSVKGISENSVKNNPFRGGTAYVAPMMMPNWNWGSPEKSRLETQIRSFKVEISRPGN